MNAPKFDDGSTNTRSIMVAEDTSLDSGEVDLVNRSFKSDNPNHKVSFGTADPKRLVVDDRIQRPRDATEINAIANDFNEAALGTITVSVRELDDGSTQYVLVDGQQRTAAALQAGYTKNMRAVFHEGLSLAEEARLFRQLNFRKGVNAQVLFKVALSEGDAEAIAIMNVLQGMNLRFGGSTGFGAVSVARRIVKRRGGLTHFHWALQMVKKIYDEDGKGVYDGRVVEAFALMHEHYLGQIDEPNLLKKLASREGGISGLIGHGRTVKQVKGGHIVPAIIDAIVLRYNSGKHAGSRTTLSEWPRRQKAAKAEKTVTKSDSEGEAQ